MVYVIMRGWRGDPEKEDSVYSIWDNEALAKKELKSLWGIDQRFHYYLVGMHLNQSKLGWARVQAKLV